MVVLPAIAIFPWVFWAQHDPTRMRKEIRMFSRDII
jgi:hypothetical protein